MTLFTNTSSRQDFFHNAFISFGDKPCDVFIAVAFFSYAEPLVELAKNGCRVKLIVRLGYPTSPSALRSILGKEGIQIRFANDRSFHPKLYIFGEHYATIGSSNLTNSALRTNQEVNITIEPAHPHFSDLVSLFVDWWDQAKVLDEQRLKEYTSVYEKYSGEKDKESLIETDLKGKQGQIIIDNIKRGLPKPSSSEVYLEGYRATYDEFLNAFRTVERIYKSIGRRKFDEGTLPLRLEIDNYFSFIREEKTTGDSYLSEPLLNRPELDQKIHSSIEEWLVTSWNWLDNEIVPKRYPTIKRIFGSTESIEKATIDEIIEALSTCHSFYDRFRFYRGGHETHIKEFKETNDVEHIKETMIYLLYGKDDFIRRMGRCIFDPAYKLNQFGRSNVQEVLGWVNDQNIPVCNNRTLRALRWLGFDVKLVGD